MVVKNHKIANQTIPVPEVNISKIQNNLKLLSLAFICEKNELNQCYWFSIILVSKICRKNNEKKHYENNKVFLLKWKTLIIIKKHSEKIVSLFVETLK